MPPLLQQLPRNWQASSSSTFRPPPLDGSMLLPEMFDWHAAHSPRHRLFIYPTESGDVKTISWEQAGKAIHTCARFIRRTLSSQSMNDLEKPPVIATLFSGDSITYLTTMAGIMKANCITLPISPRNSPEAIAHLINKVGVAHVLLGQEATMTDLANAAIAILKAKYSLDTIPTITRMPLFEELYFAENCDGIDDPAFKRKNKDAIIMYLHSSGTTAFPKPIPWTNRHFLQLCLLPYWGERNFSNDVWSLHGTPMYHGMGVAHIAFTAACGHTLSHFEPKSPPVIPTPESQFAAAIRTNCNVISAIPAFVEAWTRKPEYVEWLSRKEFGALLYGGGPLNKSAGDYLVSQGVSLFSFYGATEAGPLATCLPAEGPIDWEYFTMSGHVDIEMVPYDNNVYELLVYETPIYEPSVVNTQIRGIPAYATSDLFVPHPSKPNYWKVYGRVDDQIMHSTGEKTNATPLESILNHDPHVNASVMFGRGRFHAGVIVDPKPPYIFDLKDANKLAEFRNKIWPTVCKMNTYAPQHSRLFKEMILVTKPSKPFQFTGKGTVRRGAVIDDYANEIDELYDNVEETTQMEIPPPSEWDIYSTTEFIRSVIGNVLIREIRDNDDLFQHGCDSLQATWIRNTLLRAIREEANIPRTETSDNFVYQYPTVAKLAEYIFKLVSGATSSSEGHQSNTQHAERVAAMSDLVEKYSQGFPKWISGRSSQDSKGYVVMVTGTTGGLGCYILSALISAKEVGRIYAINRPRKVWQKSLVESQKGALLDRGLDADGILSSPKLRLLEADCTTPGFRLNRDIYDEMKNSVTHIIHNAWSVDFNLALVSFEPEIRGLRNLVDFCLTSPLHEVPKLIYCSSIGIFRDFDQPPGGVPETHVPADIPAGMGYTESKWVSEEILTRVAQVTPLKPLIVRVGQLSGGINGCWNTKEWFPCLVQASTVMGCFPTENELVDWIPLDMAANVFLDFLQGSFDQETIVHLIHPRPVPWAILANTISSVLRLPTVSFVEWVGKLEALLSTKSNLLNGGDESGATLELSKSIPALRLLTFYKSVLPRLGKSEMAMGFPKLLCSNAERLSKTLANASQISQLDGRHAKAWLAYWRENNFLKDIEIV